MAILIFLISRLSKPEKLPEFYLFGARHKLGRFGHGGCAHHLERIRILQGPNVSEVAPACKN